MPTPGLSLVGAIDQQQAALHHLRLASVPVDASDAALLKEWADAQAKLGAPIARAGMPDIQPIPAPHDAYIQQLLSEDWVQTALQIHNLHTTEFCLVEIAPLLAYQFIVDIGRSDHHCATLATPTLADLLPVCLPLIQPTVQDEAPLIDHQGARIIFKIRNLNARLLQGGAFGYEVNGYKSIIAGMQLHIALPFVHVTRFNGRCYLHNGYHRAYGAARSGATHLPCLLRDAADEQDAGIVPEGPVWQTFPLRLLESSNPPTIGHFIEGRAHAVQLRNVSRYLHVTWSESALPDEYDRIRP